MKYRFPLVACVLFLLSACRTVPLPGTMQVAVPEGLSPQNIEIAILSAVLNVPPPPTYDPTVEMSPEDFNKLVWETYLRNMNTKSWSVESRQPGRVVAAVQVRSHYLQVALSYDKRAVYIDILRSENLKQTDTRIHKRVVAWLRNLKIRLQRELRRYSALH